MTRKTYWVFESYGKGHVRGLLLFGLLEDSVFRLTSAEAYCATTAVREEGVKLKFSANGYIDLIINGEEHIIVSSNKSLWEHLAKSIYPNRDHYKEID